MASDNDIVINPDPNPAPQPVPVPPAPVPPAPPAPVPAPSPANALTPEVLKTDFDLAIKTIRGISQFLPGTLKGTVDRVLSIAEIVQNQPWLFDVAVAVINHFHAQGIDPALATPEQVNAAIFTTIVKKGEDAKAAKAK